MPDGTMSITDRLKSGQPISPADALELLKNGNERFVTMHRLVDPGVNPEIRVSLRGGQHPYATILCCSDSRVPPEIVFDEGLGHLFVVRVAGNVITSATLGSIEYATLHSTSRLIVVMGHQSCGAVTAATDLAQHHPGDETSDIFDLLYRIVPAVQQAQAEVGDDDQQRLIEKAVSNNVAMVVEQIIQRSQALRHMVENKAVMVVGGYYSLDTGEVSFYE